MKITITRIVGCICIVALSCIAMIISKEIDLPLLFGIAGIGIILIVASADD